jgi:rhombotail lipoprotein
MDYLYPKSLAAPKPNPAGAKLKLPLRIGLAFVPSSAGDFNRIVVSPTSERPLLEILKAPFKDKPWVKDIRVIPSSYLTPKGGFDNLDQVRRLYGMDVIALVSVDQIQYTNPKWYSLAYLSIVGAYVLKGDENDTRTLIDAAVFEVPTRTFLLRAPGQSVVKGSSTAINVQQRLREDAAKGLEMAMKELAKNLEAEVDAFKIDVTQGERQDVDVITKEGESMRPTTDANGVTHRGGAFGGAEVLLGCALAVGAVLRRRRS